MLIFGPYRALPKTNPKLVVYNFNSQTMDVPLLHGLVVAITGNVEDEFQFDLWYRNYILNNPIAFHSMFSIIRSLYEGHDVYVCISEYITNPYSSLLIESFIRFIKDRYGVRYAIINTLEDYDYLQKDGCDFPDEQGVLNVTDDLKQTLLNEKVQQFSSKEVM